MHRLILAVVCLDAVTPAVRAQLDPEWLKKPYRLTLVLHVDPHPVLTGAYVGQLQRDLREALQRDLRDAGTVELITEHPLLSDILKQGWGALDRQHAIDEVKLHFVRVRFADGQYEVEARQVDGSTGLVSPLRRVRTPDRLWVARLAALTIGQDFGVAGELGETTGTVVRLRVKGNVKGPSSVLRVEPGEVFALAQVRQGRDGRPRGVRVPDALLYVVDVRDGECMTRLFHRYENPLQADRTVLGYRALKLGTRHAPLELRVVDARTGEPLPGCAVTASPTGFDTPQVVDLGATDAQGRVRSKELFRDVAFVRLTLGGRPRAQMPVPLVDDQPVEVRINLSPEAEAFAEFEYRYRQWARRVGELSLQVDEEVRQITALDRQDQTQAAVAKARALAARLKEDIPPLRQHWEAVKASGKGAGQPAEALIAQGERALAALAAQAQSLEDYVQREENPTSAQKLVKQARLLEEAAEAEEAIRLYQEALTLDPNQPAMQAHLKKLQAAWQLKGEAHRQARVFIYETWGRLPWEELERNLPRAREALRTCETAGDFLSARKLAKVNLAHLERLAGVLGQLAPATSAEDQEKAQLIARLADGLGDLNRRIGEFLERSAK